ncbi:MAG TPA: serine/threonine-protein kinase [Phycisphaerales bacterium]|nr:serine/threonine-protein kinase [Phycisphaerales bacterium]
MTGSLDARAKPIFEHAFELADQQRGPYLDSACGRDSALRTRVEALLAAGDKEDAFLRQPPPDPAADSERIGAHIGPYRLLERIGEGGFGSVFLAEQEAPVRRLVALKIIKLGMDTRAVVARFEHERQALALMDHPNIAKVLDAGATASGRPYFVMELVRGEPITSYCDRANLPIPERLALFTQVCRAVQHAHEKGIIHRDIKPSNILVGEQDGRPFCRIIDFGIAKAVRRSGDALAFTEQRQLVGTPEYMSPEQAAGGADVDTRTDVYSLGVLLYELLAGAPPLDGKRLRSAAFGEMQRIIREVDPPAPSARLLQSRETIAAVASNRHTEPRRLGSIIRGELDWIALRAIEKDRARRYDSPGRFAADIERYLAGQAVEAAPPSAAYRLRKTIARHRIGVSAAALVFVSLVAGLAAALWQARIAAHDRDRARRSEAAAIAARGEAEARRKETEQVAAFQQSQLQGLDPEAMGRRMRERMIASAREGLERAGASPEEIARKQEQLGTLLGEANPTDVALRTLDESIFERALHAAEEQFKDQPLVRARLLQTIAETLKDLGLMERAEAPQREALEIRRRSLGDASSDTIASILGMGSLRLAQSRFAEAEPFYREGLSLARRVLGEDHYVTLGAVNDLGLVLQAQGKRDEAARLLASLLERMRKVLGPDDPQTLQMTNNMGGLMMDSGKPAEAEGYFRDALERRRRVSGEDDVDTLLALNNLALSLEKQNRPREAEAMYREALERSRRARGNDHPDTLLYMSNLGFVLRSLGDLDSAEQLSREALDRRRATLGKDNPDTWQSEHNLGLVLVDRARAAEGEPLLREALAARERQFGVDSEPAGQTRREYARALAALGRRSEAEAILIQEEARSESSPARHRRAVEGLVAFYSSCENAEPGKGWAAKGAQWRARLGQAQAPDGDSHPGPEHR